MTIRIPEHQLRFASARDFWSGYPEPQRVMMALRRNIVMTLATGDNDAVERMRHDTIACFGAEGAKTLIDDVVALHNGPAFYSTQDHYPKGIENRVLW